MALRIEDIIQHGWIDNTSQGVITGELYLVGQSEPVSLALKGNGSRDIAGTRIEFKNHSPSTNEVASIALFSIQKGMVGKMTCSLRRMEATIPLEDMEVYLEKHLEIPHHWKNALYLEWYSIANGRVILESSSFEISISHHKWSLSSDEARQQSWQQKRLVEQFVQISKDMADAEAKVNFDSSTEADEYEWEKRLRLMDHIDEAEWMLEEDFPAVSDQVQDVVVEREADESMSGRTVVVQLAHHTQEEILEKLGGSIMDQGPRGLLAASICYVFSLVDDAFPEAEIEQETGYQLALMKRTAFACNSSIAHCNTLLLEDDSYEEIRDGVHLLRDCILDTIRQFRKSKKE